MEIIIKIPERNKLYQLKESLLLSYIESLGLNETAKTELIEIINLKLSGNEGENTI